MTDEQKVQLLPCPFCGGETRTSRHNGDERIGYNITVTISCNSCGASLPLVSRHDKNDWCTESAQSVTERAITAWNTRQAALSHASATAEEGSVDGDAARLDALQEWITSGLRVEFAKSIIGDGVEIGLRSPCVAKVANTIRDAIDQAIAAKRGDQS